MESKTYGRNIVRGKNEVYHKRLFTSWGVLFAIGFIIGLAVMMLINKPSETKTYGTIDEMHLVNEVPVKWSNGFVPLDVPMDNELQEFIYCLSTGYNIEFPVVMGLIETESGFRTDAISKTNDYGLMQINKVNHGWLSTALGITDFTNPYENTRAGIFILRDLFEKYEEPSKVLMAYKFGETGAARLWKQGVSDCYYSNKIMNNAVKYEQQIAEKSVEK